MDIAQWNLEKDFEDAERVIIESKCMSKPPSAVLTAVSLSLVFIGAWDELPPEPERWPKIQALLQSQQDVLQHLRNVRREGD